MIGIDISVAGRLSSTWRQPFGSENGCELSLRNSIKSKFPAAAHPQSADISNYLSFSHIVLQVVLGA
jgi:hypothetical protein